MWTIRLSETADQDFRDVVAWTDSNFGATQARRYAAALSATIERLQRGPATSGVRARADIGEGLFSIQVKLRRRRGPHLVFFRVADHVGEVVVLRILHDAMDLTRHIASEVKDQA